MSELWTHSATELAGSIRRRDVSPLQVVEAHIARIRQVNGTLNALVQPRFDAALEEAAAQTTRWSEGEALPPFAGVPFTIKEHVAVRGLPQTAGLVSRRHCRASHDATVVARMREAGFVLVGTTNVPEGLMWFETHNRLYGRTCNAFSVEHTPGGSSGGEGALIAQGGVPVGIGGDIGGSIRNPAFFNGIVGHKTSGGRIPGTGTWPGDHGPIARYRVLGPMARTVGDVRALMPILVGSDGVDPTVDGPSWADDVPPLSDVTVYYFEDNGVVSPSPAVRRAVSEAVEALARRGCRVEAWRPPGIEGTFRLWADALSTAGSASFRTALGDGVPIDLGRAWWQWLQGRSNHMFPSLALATLSALGGSRLPLRGGPSLVEMRGLVEAKLGPRGVLLCPTFHRSAPRHGFDCVRHFLGFTYAAFFNPLEMPATAVPVGVGEGPLALPVGVQVAAIRHGDVLTLAVAEAIEAAVGGWRPRPIQGAV